MTMAQASAEDIVPIAYADLESFKFLQTAFPILFIKNEDGSLATCGQGKDLLKAVDPSINNTIEDLFGWVTSSDFESSDVQLSAALKSKLRRVVREHMDMKAKNSEDHENRAGSGTEDAENLAHIQLPQSKASIKMRRASVTSVGSTVSNYSVSSVKRKNSIASAPTSTMSTPVPDVPFSIANAAGPHMYPASLSMPHLPSMMNAGGAQGIMLPLQQRHAITNPNTPAPGAAPGTALPISKRRKNSTSGNPSTSNLASNFYNNRSSSDLTIEYQEINFMYKDVQWEIKWTETHGNIHVSKTGGWMKVIVSAINRRFNFFMSHKTHKQLVLPVDNTLLTYVHVAMHFISTLPAYPFENKNCLVNYVELNKQNILNNVAECAALCRGVGKCALCDTIHEGDPKAYDYWRNYAIVNVPGESGRGMLCSVAELRAGGPFLKPQPGTVTATPICIPPPPMSFASSDTSPAASSSPGAPESANSNTTANGATVTAASAAPTTAYNGLPSRPVSASPPNMLFPGGLVAMHMSHPHSTSEESTTSNPPAALFSTHMLPPGFPHAGVPAHLHSLPPGTMMTTLPLTMSMLPPHMFKGAAPMSIAAAKIAPAVVSSSAAMGKAAEQDEGVKSESKESNEKQAIEDESAVDSIPPPPPPANHSPMKPVLL